MRVKPLHSKILVKLDLIERKEKTDGGIYIPDSTTVTTTQKTGIVISLGNDEATNEVISIGDKLLMPIYAGLIVDINDEEHLIIDYHEVLAILEKESCLTLI